MNELMLFQKEEFGQVRVVERNGEPWFVAKDVCECLELTNTSQTLSYLDDDEKGIISNDTPGGKQEMLIISEPGLYSLILRSRKPEAKAFKRWIVHEVIPAIRKHGRYAVSSIPDFTDPVEAARAWADEREAAQLAQATAQAAIAERDHAIKTKAWINDKKTATAMNTASQLSKENGKLKDALGEGRTWKQVTAIEWLNQYFAPSPGLWSPLGRKLSSLSDELGYEVRRAPSTKYGSVGLYHVDVIERLRERLDAHTDMLWKFRKTA